MVHEDSGATHSRRARGRLRTRAHAVPCAPARYTRHRPFTLRNVEPVNVRRGRRTLFMQARSSRAQKMEIRIHETLARPRRRGRRDPFHRHRRPCRRRPLVGGHQPAAGRHRRLERPGLLSGAYAYYGAPAYYPEPVYYSAPDLLSGAGVYAPRVYAPRPRVWVAPVRPYHGALARPRPRPRQVPPRPARRLAALSRRRRGSGLRAQAAASRRARENCPTRPARAPFASSVARAAAGCRGPATGGPRGPPGEPIMSLRSPLLSAVAVGTLALVTACSSTPTYNERVYEASGRQRADVRRIRPGDEHRDRSRSRRGRRAPARSSAR